MLFKTAFVVLSSIFCWVGCAQASGEASEISLEARDAAFSAADAAREAAAWRDDTVVQTGADPLTQLSAAADLIFRGRVTSQSYVYDASDTPFTQTTFAIDGLLKGERVTGEFSLLQEGGPSRARDGRFMLVSSSAHFSVGEEELLFVELDEDETLAHRRVSIEHRFRIVDDRVYNEDGRGLILETSDGDPASRLRLSDDRHPDDRFSTIRIGEQLLHKHFESRNDSALDTTPHGRRLASAMPGVAAPGRSYRDSVHVDDLRAALFE